MSFSGYGLLRIDKNQPADWRLPGVAEFVWALRVYLRHIKSLTRRESMFEINQ